jgi:osmotically-inducible protein OsmY
MKTAPELKKEIINALKRYPALNSREIKIDVIGDIAWLSGTINRYYKKYLIKEAVKNITGIKHFRIDVCVDLSKQKPVSDKEIKKVILNRLSNEIPGNKIIVSVTDGIVILTGQIFSDEQKEMALKSVFTVAGILNVWDFIKINKTVNAILGGINLVAFHEERTDTNNPQLIKTLSA